MNSAVKNHLHAMCTRYTHGLLYLVHSQQSVPGTTLNNPPQNTKTHQAQPIILGLGVFVLAVELFFSVLLLGCLSTS